MDVIKFLLRPLVRQYFRKELITYNMLNTRRAMELNLLRDGPII